MNVCRVPLQWPQRSFALALFFVVAGASAHDTWFASRGPGSPGAWFLSLGTGHAFPVFDSPVGPEHLQRRGCREGGKRVPFSAVAQASGSLLLKAGLRGTAASSCWAQLNPSELELPPELVAIYLAEAQPPAWVHAAWSAMQARGLPWKERYTKHARIVFSGSGPDGAQPTNAQPGDMGMDMVLLGQGGVIREADTVTVQVLRDGRGLPDFAVELRHAAPGHTVGTGRWHRTDGQGRVRLHVPQAGTWLLRGIDIRKSGSVPDSWDTRFATLAFDVAAAR